MSNNKFCNNTLRKYLIKKEQILIRTIIVFLLPIMLLLVVATKFSFTVEATMSGLTGECEWRIEDGVLTISGEGSMGDYSRTEDNPYLKYDFDTVVISESVTNIGERAFFGCSDLVSIQLPSSVTSIGNCAFMGCSSLKSVTIPDSVTRIGSLAFGNCSNLTRVNVTDLKAWCEIDFDNPGSNPLDNEGGLYLNDILITDLVIPNNVTSINSYAFYGCSSLKSVTIPKSVTRISGSAFYDCSRLAKVHVTDLKAWCEIDFKQFANPLFNGGELYLNDILITDLVIPNNVTSIGSWAFDGCNSLTSVTISEGVTSIGSWAFSGCSSLTSVTISEGVTSIGASAFNDCSSLTSVTIPKSVTSINSYAFEDCSSLTSVTILEGVTSIGSYAFNGCSSLTSVTIPNSVTNIDSFVFWRCNNLVSITLPFVGSSRNAIGTSDAVFGYLFGSTTSPENNGIRQFYASGYNYEYYYIPSSLKNVTITDAMQIPYGAFYSCDMLTSINISEGVTSIDNRAFEGCSSLTSVTIPESVTSIDSAFYGCSGLKTVNFNATNCTSMGSSTSPIFKNCTNLTAINIGNGVGRIPSYAFKDCSSIASVTIPASVTFIGDSAFDGCSELKIVNFNATNCASMGSYTSPVFENCTNLITINIGNGVTEIPSQAFQGCSGLTSVTIPKSVRYIGDSAFYGCNNLISMTLPFVGSSRNASDVHYAVFGYIFGYDSNSGEDRVQQYYKDNKCCYYYIPSSLRNVTITDTTQIPYGAFDSCDMLTSINIPEGVTSIGNRAFDGCRSLSSMTIPKSVTSIGNYAFLSCKGLNSIDIPNSVMGVAEGTFSGCSGLTSMTIPKSVTSIGNYAFSNCKGLNSIDIPNSVTSIAEGTFSGCSGLTSVTIPKSVTSIGNRTFDGCISLTSVTISKSVTSIGGSAFEGCDSLTDVWYDAGKPSRAQTDIGTFNSCLEDATWHYVLCDEEHVYNQNQNLTCGICGVSKQPDSPVIESKTNNSVTLVTIDGYEYSKDGMIWQTSNVFTNLLPDTTYIFCQRVKETEVAIASEISEGLLITFKSAQTAPTAPVISSYTDTTVTLLPISSVEYSRDGETWQASNVFDSLSARTEYIFYQRYMETDTHEASDKSSGASVTTDRSKQTLIPYVPTVQSVTESSIILVALEGCEYSKDGTTWQSSNVFSNLSCGTEYTFYQRYKETDTTYAGNSSNPLKARTDKGVQVAPYAPTLSAKTHNSVVLTAISGYEYSRDGVNWQTSNVFTGLNPETNYMFYQRKAENNRYYASDSSALLIVKTDEEPTHTVGDIDGVEGVTDADAEYMLMHTFFPEDYPVNQDCDFNGDGKVTDADAEHLLMHTFFPEDYPLTDRRRL